MADPTVIQCAGSCTVTVVHELSLPPLQLTPEEGAQIGGAILAVWAVAWCIRQAIKAVQPPGANRESEE